MIHKFREELNQRKGQQKALSKELNTKEDAVFILNEDLLDLEEAVLIVQKVTKDTQEVLLTKINELVTDALEVVFEGEGYSFELQAETKANGLQLTPIVKQDGHEYSLKADTGYGITQLIAYAMRIALLSIKKGSTKIILLDEPNASISAEYKQKASELMVTVANKLKVQHLVVTHEESIKEVADHTFKVSKNKGVSYIEELVSESVE